MCKNKTLSKKIRFNFFEIVLKADDEILKTNLKKLSIIKKLKEKKKLSKKQKERINEENNMIKQTKLLDNYEADSWNMKGMLEQISSGKLTGTDIEVDDVYIEIEPNSFTPIENEIISFQLSKLRDTFLPAKKRLGKEKEDIKLEDEEYIGEFVSIIYDCKNCAMMVQSNNYGLSTRKIEKYFTLLRRKFIEELGNKDLIKELVCELRVIMDPDKTKKVLDAECFRKIRIKGSDIMLDSFIDSKSLLGQIRRSIGVSKGINFDISIAVNSTKRTESLDSKQIISLVNDFNSIPKEKDKPMIEISKKNDEDSNVELVNLLSPRLTDIINFKIERRKPVEHSFLYSIMKVNYDNKREIISEILRSS